MSMLAAKNMDLPNDIKKLDETVINKIAAGEIIQRPCNALKELIENCLDAKSTNIQIIVKNGGLKLLQIQDNGHGIKKEDFGIVCERFTTSKLTTFEDLQSINTYGFRGEALASISHIAHLTITSKTKNEVCAYTASYIDGKPTAPPKPVAGNQGTIIKVEDLFYNMTVRKQALRGTSEEHQKIAEVVIKYAVHNGHCAFSLKKLDGNVDVKTPGNSNTVENIRLTYGNNVARELIEFNLDNDELKFKLRGYMTNLCYSHKKYQFLLFINHRLVECSVLKKSIDMVYSSYLMKNMHPFIYLSVEIDPRYVDVNVHPTKHEVMFLNEDQIIKSILEALESKLLASNRSRNFYTQSKLPGTVEIESAPLKDKRDPNKLIHPKDMVRTDPNQPKLQLYFGQSMSNEELEKSKIEEMEKKVAKSNVSITEEQFEKHHEVFAESGKKFEENLFEENAHKTELNDTPIAKNHKIHSAKPITSYVKKLKRVETQLTSVHELRKTIESDCHRGLREAFAQHVFVGSVDPIRALIQYSTKLYICNTKTLMKELFYQMIIYNFQGLGKLKLPEPIPLHDLALMALHLESSGWTPEDGPREYLAQQVVSILNENAPMLSDYFSMDIDENGLKSLPLLLDNYLPLVSGLPEYILRLATNVNWENEKQCFHTFAQETALYYSEISEETKYESNNWKWIVEHVCYRALKDYFIPPKSFVKNASVLEVTSLPRLYKVFERC